MAKYVCTECGYEKETAMGIRNCPECKGEGTMEKKSD